MRLMIADDSLEIRSILSESGRNEGYEIVTAAAGWPALEVVNHEK